MNKYVKNIKYFSADIIGMFFAYLASILAGVYLEPVDITNVSKTILNLIINAISFMIFYLLAYHILHIKQYYLKQKDFRYDIKELLKGFSKSMTVNYSLKGIGFYVAISTQVMPIWLVPVVIFPPAELLGYYIRQRHNFKKGFFSIYFKKNN